MTNKQTKQKRTEKRNRKKEGKMHVITDKQNTFLSCSIFTYYFHMSTAVNRELINSTFSFLLTLEFDLWTLHKRTNDIYFVVSTDNKYIVEAWHNGPYDCAFFHKAVTFLPHKSFPFFLSPTVGSKSYRVGRVKSYYSTFLQLITVKTFTF